MRFFSRKIIPICLVATFSLPIFAKKQETDPPDQRKAEYFYLESVIKRTEGDDASAYELVKRAYELDSDNTIYGYYYGYGQLRMGNQAGLALMKRHFQEHPQDFYENYIYAMASNQLGKTNDAIDVWEKLLEIYPEKTQIYPMLANSYAGIGNYAKAIAAYDSLERTEGKSNAITVRKIGLMFALNDTTAALDEGRKLLKEAPQNLTYNVLMGDIHLQLHHTDSAMAYYDKAQKIDPDNGYVNLSKANVYRQTGDSLRYEQEITTAILNKDMDVESKVGILTSYIRKCIEDGDESPERVHNMFGVVIEQHPHETVIRKLYCDYLIYQGDYKNAGEQLSYVLDLAPTDVENWKRLMWVYLYMSNPQKTIETGEKALSYNPDELSFYQIMGSAYYQLRDYDKSIETYLMLLEKDKASETLNESDIYSGLADAYHQKGEKEKAYECYEKAIALSPNNYLALNNYAYFLCLDGKDLDKAEQMSKATVNANPENVSYLDTYAWICFLKQDYKQALEYIEKAFGENGDEAPSAEMYEHYGDILFMNGKPDEALAQWKKALELDSGSELLKRKVKNKTYFYE